MKKISMLITLLTMGATLISCNGASKVSYEDHLLNHPNKSFNNSYSSLNENYVKSLQSFSADFLEKTYKEGENNIFSPISIATCFSMLLEGCKENSKKELMDALHYDDSFNYSEEIKRMLLNTAVDYVSSYDNKQEAFLDINQSFFVHNKFKEKVREDYLKTLEDYYFAEAFQGRLESDEMHDLLAKWINDKTNNFFNLKGKDFKDLGGVLWLVNTIYMKAKWAFGFSNYEGNDTSFTSLDGKEQTAKYLISFEDSYVYSNDDYMINSIPLRGGLYFRVLLPNDVSKAKDVFKSKEAYLNLLNPDDNLKGEKSHVHYKIPEFKFVKNYALVDIFKALGVKDIFDPDYADLSGISDTARIDGLHVTNAIHSAGIDVNKSGIEAAGYTIIEAGESSIEEPEQLEDINFYLDHPFMYTLGFRDSLPLFMGVESSL